MYHKHEEFVKDIIANKYTSDEVKVEAIKVLALIDIDDSLIDIIDYLDEIAYTIKSR